MDTERARILSVADLSVTPHMPPPLHPMHVKEEDGDMYAEDPTIGSWAANVEEMLSGEVVPPGENLQDSTTPRPMEDVLVSPAVQEPSSCKPKQLPKPIPPTAEEIKVCPHRVRCINCRKEGHDAESSNCPFWYARFNRGQIDALNKQVRDRQDRGRLQSNPVLPNV